MSEGLAVPSAAITYTPVVTTPSITDEIGALVSPVCKVIQTSSNTYAIRISGTAPAGASVGIRAKIGGLNLAGKTAIGSASAWCGLSTDNSAFWNSVGSAAVIVQTDGDVYIMGTCTTQENWVVQYSAVLVVSN